MSAQLAGAVLVGVGAALLWNVWALVIIGLLLLVVPELAAMRRRT